MSACNCDWPGCQGQCHTGDSCPCHPTADTPEPLTAEEEATLRAAMDSPDPLMTGAERVWERKTRRLLATLDAARAEVKRPPAGGSDDR